jgi:hypothetical protein
VSGGWKFAGFDVLGLREIMFFKVHQRIEAEMLDHEELLELSFINVIN